MVVLAAVQATEIGAAVDAEAAPSITNEPFRLRSAASVISGKLLLQPEPLRVYSRTRLPPRCTISR